MGSKWERENGKGEMRINFIRLKTQIICGSIPLFGFSIVIFIFYLNAWKLIHKKGWLKGWSFGMMGLVFAAVPMVCIMLLWSALYEESIISEETWIINYALMLLFAYIIAFSFILYQYIAFQRIKMVEPTKEITEKDKDKYI